MVEQTMARAESTQVQFTDPEAPELSDYRPVDLWVILAIALALLSLTAFLVPLFWIVPLLATGVSIVALRSVHDDTRPTSGRKGAVVALVISLFILGAAPARYITIMTMIAQQGRNHAEAWLELVRQGRLQEAHQLTLSLYSRVSPQTSLEGHYQERPSVPTATPNPMAMMEEFSPAAELQNLFSQPGLREIVKAAPDVEFELVRSAGFERDSGPNTQVLDLRYVARYEVDGKPQRSRFRVLMERTLFTHSGVTHWRVRSVDDIDALGIRD
jgi:hypothetical protein